MNTMDTNMYWAESKDEETHTLTKEEKDEALRRLAGVWADDPEGEMMAEAIRTGRRSNKSRKLISFDE